MLVATDLTARSDRAFYRACLLAKQNNQPLTILYVVDKKLPEGLGNHTKDWAEDNLKKLVEQANIEDLKTEIIVETGHPVETIVNIGREHELIVMGLHNDKISHKFSHTTAGKIVHKSINAMLLVRETARNSYSNVIAGIDFSLYSMPAIAQAHLYAPEATLHLVHAYHTPFSGMSFGASSEQHTESVSKQFCDFVAKELDNSNERAQQMGLTKTKIQTHLVEGEASSVLFQCQQKTSADLIVLATHSRPTLTRAIFGSVADAMLQTPPCDLLVVRPF